MPPSLDPRIRKFTVIAQDPAVREARRIVTAQVDVPVEVLAPGPRGYRVHVVDYDSTQNVLYRPAPIGLDLHQPDAYAHVSDDMLIADPKFHAQNVYALVMRVLARFELALGRRVSWAFFGHQLQIAPHAFAEANAYYSRQDHGLLFGYFLGRRRHTIFSCLSHDVVVHETTHALLDGVRPRFTDPSLPDQPAFHEGYADVVALLSVFSLRGVMECLLRTSIREQREKRRSRGVADPGPADAVERSSVDAEWLKKSAVFRLADEMGSELSERRGKALRRSLDLTPSPGLLDSDEFQEPHRRGEVLVAAVLDAMAGAWARRLADLTQGVSGAIAAPQIAEAGAEVADYLLTVVIRALDYCPPIDLFFGDFLSAILTAEHEIVRESSAGYGFQERLRESFSRWEIAPKSNWGKAGVWLPPEQEGGVKRLTFEGIHLESLQRDPDEVFRFLWENRKALELHEGAYAKVLSVRPSVRVGRDGFVLRETVAEYMQMMDVSPADLRKFQVDAPKNMPRDARVRLYGGGTLIFDEFGGLKYHVHKRISSPRQNRKVKHLWETGTLEQRKRIGFRPRDAGAPQFAALHRRRWA